MPIKDYSTNPGSNTTLFPEGMAPSAVNDGMRQVQADIRTFYNTAEWRDFGDVPVFIDGDTFTVTGDQSVNYKIGRRIKLSGSLMATVYATITGVSVSTNTTVDYKLDSGTVTSDLNKVQLGLDLTNSPFMTDKSFGTVGGAANALTLTLPLAPVAYTDGMKISGFVSTTNTTDAVNVNVNGLGVKSFKIKGADPLIGTLVAGNYFEAVYKSATGFYELTTPVFIPASSKAEAETGTENTKFMTSLRTKEAIDYRTIGASLSKTSNQVLGGVGVWTTISWNAENYDDANFWSSSAAAALFAPADGRYLVNAIFESNSNEAGTVGLRIRKFNTSNAPVGFVPNILLAIPAGVPPILCLSWPFNLAAGEYVVVDALRNSTNLSSIATNSGVTIQRVR